MSNLTDKQLSIVEGLNKAFPDGEVTRSELMEWAQRSNFAVRHKITAQSASI